jgi:hypothetical protein
MKIIISLYKKYYWIGLIIISMIGIRYDLILTKQGAGASGDSVWYLQGAENLIKGLGYGILRSDGFIPNKMFPPFYSITLAGLSVTGLPLMVMGRFFNALLLGLVIFLIGWLVYQLTGSPTTSIIASCFVFLSFDFFFIFTWVMSEPLYTFLSVVCLCLFYQYHKYRKPVYLYSSVFFAGLSVITRYIGISLVAAICSWVLIFEPKKIRSRILDVTILFLIGILPAVIFLIASSGNPQAAGRSAILFRSIPKENLVQLEKALIGWYSPIFSTIPKLMRRLLEILLLLISISPYLFYFRSINRTPIDKPGFLLRDQFLALIYIGFYLIIMLLSIILSLAGNPTDSSKNQVLRYILPIYPIFILFMAIMFYLIYQKLCQPWKIPYIQYSPLLVSISLSLVLLNNFSWQVKTPQHFGYTEIKNSYPKLVDQLILYSASRPILASNYELAYFLIDKPVFSIVGRGNELTGIPDPNYSRYMDNIMKEIKDNGVVILFISNPDNMVEYQSVLADLHVIDEYGQITLYSTTGK